MKALCSLMEHIMWNTPNSAIIPAFKVVVFFFFYSNSVQIETKLCCWKIRKKTCEGKMILRDFNILFKPSEKSDANTSQAPKPCV